MDSEFSFYVLDQLANWVVLYFYNFKIFLDLLFFDEVMLTFPTVIMNSLVFFVIL